MTLQRVAIPSPNYSSRGGARVTTIVLHTAQGARTYESLGNFFQNPRSGVSSHVGIDDSPGVIGEYVRRDFKSWAASAANPWSVQAELCAFAEWDLAEWNRHPVMLENTAAWIAEEAAHFGIPIVGLDSGGAENPNVRGVCQHADLGKAGGGHWDAGPGFPMRRVLDMARGTAPAPTPPPVEDERMASVTTDHDGNPWYFTVGKDGQVWANAGGESGNFWSIGGQGIVKSGPDAAVQPDGRIIVAATGNDGAVWATSRDPGDGKWTPWWSMGGK